MSHGYEDFIAENFRSYLKKVYEEKKHNNKRFSLRAFGKHLGLSHSALSEYLNGKRRPTKLVMQKVFSILNTPIDIQNSISQSYKFDPSQYIVQSSVRTQTLDSWLDLAILELVRVKDFKNDVNWIAEKLGVSQEDVSHSIEKSLSCGALKRDNNGAYLLTGENLTTLGQAEQAAVIEKVIKDFLQLQIVKMNEVPIEKRSAIGLLVAMDPDDLPEARSIIYKFVRELSAFLERPSAIPKQVFRLNVGLFPVSNTYEDQSKPI